MVLLIIYPKKRTDYISRGHPSTRFKLKLQTEINVLTYISFSALSYGGFGGMCAWVCVGDKEGFRITKDSVS